jgi:hypothetical protein
MYKSNYPEKIEEFFTEVSDNPLLTETLLEFITDLTTAPISEEVILPKNR